MSAPAPKKSAGRVPPHSLEAEMHVLGAAMVDGSAIIARCEAADITPASFYLPAHRAIYQQLLALHTAGQPTELPVVAEEMKRSRLLQEIGGYTYLAKISDHVATTAQAAHFIAKVAEHARLRDIIQIASGALERCYASTGPADLEQILKPLRTAGDGGDPVGERIRAAMLDTRRPPAEPQARWLIDHKPVCTPGNLTAIVAQAKSGKTAFIGAFIAAAIVAQREKDGHELKADTLGVEATAPAGRLLIHFDTEQSPFDHFKTVLRACCRAGTTTAPEWLWSFGCAGWSSADLRRALAEALSRARRKRLAIHGIILDGVADFCADVNDAEESNALIAELHAHAIAAAAPVICVVHRNEGDKADSAARGHLGKQLARKAETNLRLEKRDGRTVCFSERNRGAPILEQDGPCFEWSDEVAYHISSASIGQTRLEQQLGELRALLTEIFAGVPELRYSELAERIQAARGISKKPAQQWITKLRRAELIIQTPAGAYTQKP